MSQLTLIFEECYGYVRPRSPLPAYAVEFYPFASLNNTIRLREGKLHVRLSDLLEGAPESVLHSILVILLSKMYRKPIEREHMARYRRYVSGHTLAEKARMVRQLRGRKRIRSPRGDHYDLEAIFEDLNTRFFHGLLARPQLTWSGQRARRSLGHYDPAHNTIVVSRVFDHPRVPRYAVEYLLYHEMLHLRHPVKLRGSRRCVHSAAFRADEKLFPHLEPAKRFLRNIPK